MTETVPRDRVSLDTWLAERIAQKDGVSVSEIDLEYIHRQRERRFYPKLKYEIGSKYGGYSSAGLRFITREELTETIRRADEVLASL